MERRPRAFSRLELGLCKRSLQGYAQPGRAQTSGFSHVAHRRCRAGGGSPALCPWSRCWSGSPREPTGARLGASGKQREIPSWSPLRWGASLQQGEEPGDMPTGSCLCRLPDRLPALPGSSLYPQVMPFHICTTQHLLMMNLVPISLPIYLLHITHIFCSSSHRSTFSSPEQLGISGRFCHVTIHPHFPDNGF